MRQRKSTTSIGVMTISALIISGLSGSLSIGQRAASAAAQAVEVGQKAPTFSLPDVKSGKTTSLESLGQGKKATVVMFIATRCPISNAYNDRMVSIAAKYASKGIAFAGINSNETEPAAECAEHAGEHKFPFPVLKDAGSKIADEYSARVTPETYVIDSKGVLVYHGRIDNSADSSEVNTHELADALDSIVADKAIARAQTKAFGCSIKRG